MAAAQVSYESDATSPVVRLRGDPVTGASLDEREAARTLVVSPDEADPTPRARGAFSELLDSNAALLEELGVV